MADQTKPPYLRLVTAPTGRTVRRGQRTQLELFLDREPNLLAMFLLAPARMRALTKAIDETRPRYVFDLRVLPSFEGAGTSRRSVFRLMEAAGSTYVDAMGRMGGTDRRNALLHSGAFEECVRSVCGTDLIGPMFFLFQSGEELAWSCSVLPKVLQPAPRRGWSIHVMCASDSASGRFERHVDTKSVQPWVIGEVLYVVASPAESTGWLLDDRGRPVEPVNLKRGCSVRVVALRIGQWTDVEVLGGPSQGRRVRLASNAHVARLVR